MLKLKDCLKQLTMLSFGAVYLVTSFFPYPFLRLISAILLVVVISHSILTAKPVNRYISAVLFLAGGVLLFQSDAYFDKWITAISSNGGLVTLFIIIPLLSFPLAYDDYEVVLKHLTVKYIYNILRVGSIYALMALFLSSFLNLGAIPVVYDLSRKGPSIPGVEKTLHLSITRGLSAANFWAPNYIGMAVVLYYLDIPWISIFPVGVALSFVMILFHWLVVRVKFRQDGKPFPDTRAEPGETLSDPPKAIKLTLSFLGLVVMTALLNIYTDLNIFVIIPVIALVYPLGLAFIMGKMDVYRREMRRYFPGLKSINNEVIIFAGAGFFGKALEISGTGQIIPVLLRFESIYHPSLAVLTIILLVSFFALFGIHSIVAITALAASVSPAAVGISLNAYAFTLLAAYSMAILLSPFSGTSLVMSGLTKRNPWELALRSNWYYCLVMSLFFAVVIPFIK